MKVENKDETALVKPRVKPRRHRANILALAFQPLFYLLMQRFVSSEAFKTVCFFCQPHQLHPRAD